MAYRCPAITRVRLWWAFILFCRGFASFKAAPVDVSLAISIFVADGAERVNPPALIVHFVDSGSAPVAGPKVAVKELSKKGKPTTFLADGDGNAKFWIEADKDYSVEVKSLGFKTKRLERVRLSKPSETSPVTHLDFPIELSGRMTTVY